MTTASDKRDDLERQLRVVRGELELARERGNRSRTTRDHHEHIGDLLTEINDLRRAIAALPLDGQIVMGEVMR